jgi:hypothetical protein
MLKKEPFDRSRLPQGPVRIRSIEDMLRSQVSVPAKRSLPPSWAEIPMTSTRVLDLRVDIESGQHKNVASDLLLSHSGENSVGNAPTVPGGIDGEQSPLGQPQNATFVI